MLVVRDAQIEAIGVAKIESWTERLLKALGPAMAETGIRQEQKSTVVDTFLAGSFELGIVEFEQIYRFARAVLKFAQSKATELQKETLILALGQPAWSAEEKLAFIEQNVLNRDTRM